MDWIRWTGKTGVSLWHRAYRATRLIRTRRMSAGALSFWVPPAPRQDPTSPSNVAFAEEVSPGSFRFRPYTDYRRTACGFTVPPYESMEQWRGEGLPPGPRCIWCVNGWVVDVSPPGSTPPTGSGASRAVRIPGGKKRPPTLHA